MIESITDSDWAGCRRTRRSRSSIQLYVAGSLVGTMVRSQRSVSLSSGEAEFVALVGGMCEALYIGDCMKFLLSPSVTVTVRSRSDSAACRGVCNRLGCGRIRHLEAGLLWVQSAVQTKAIELGIIAGADNPADIGTKPLSGPRLRELLFLMGVVTPQMEAYGESDREEAVQKKALAKTIKEMGTSGVNVARIKTMMPLLVLMTQIVNVQGLSLAAPFLMLGNEDDVASWVATAAVGFLVWLLVAWLPSLCYRGLKWSLEKLFRRAATADAAVGPDLPDLPDEVVRHTASTQANIPWRHEASKEDRLFAEEYVRRCTHLEQVYSERCREVEACGRALREVRDENRALRATIENLRRRRDPEEIVVATSRGQRFHLPTCGHVRDSIVKRYTPCRDCIGPTG